MKLKLTLITMLGLGLLCANTYAATTSKTHAIKENKMQIQTPQDQNKTEGEAFLAANKKKPGVVTLASGLQYKIIKKGKGPKPMSNDTVTVNYRGTLIDGKEFDCSYTREEPATFPVNGVIAGWTEALQLMPVGSTWELYIPANLAYGSRGAPPIIGPNQTLIFKVELLEIKK